MAELGVVMALIDEAGSPDPEVIEQAVSDWLDDHPEAACPIDDDAGEGDTDKVWSADKSAEVTTSLSEAIAPLTPAATSGDVGKFLKAKTVSGGKVTEYEFGEGGGGSVTVDDELSDSSTNPVQNKVITGAIAPLTPSASSGDVGKVLKAKTVADGKVTEYELAGEEQYRLIKTVTIADADTTVAYVDTDENGEPFSLHDIVIDFDMELASGTSNAWVIPNVTSAPSDATNMAALTVQNLFNSAAKQRRIARINVSGGRFFGESEYTTFDNIYANLYTVRNRNATGLFTCDPISKLRIWSMNSHKFGQGSTIKIYGR